MFSDYDGFVRTALNVFDIPDLVARHNSLGTADDTEIHVNALDLHTFDGADNAYSASHDTDMRGPGLCEYLS